MVESRHRRVVNTSFTLLFRANVPKCYYCYVSRTVVFVLNCIPFKIIQFKSLYFLLDQREYDYLFLKMFGSLCNPCLRAYRTNKLDAKSTSCVFIGYSPHQKGYLCLEKATSKVYTNRHVVFVEHIFPYVILTGSTLTNSMSSFDPFVIGSSF